VPGFSPATRQYSIPRRCLRGRPGRGAAARLDLRQLEYCVGFITFVNYEMGSGEYYAKLRRDMGLAVHANPESRSPATSPKPPTAARAWRIASAAVRPTISGGPYHFKLLTFDGASLGSQDQPDFNAALFNLPRPNAWSFPG